MDLPIPKAELEKFHDMLSKFGDLTKIERDGKVTYSYENKYGRAGYEVPPGLANEPGGRSSPLALDEILRSRRVGRLHLPRARILLADLAAWSRSAAWTISSRRSRGSRWRARRAASTGWCASAPRSRRSTSAADKVTVAYDDGGERTRAHGGLSASAPSRCRSSRRSRPTCRPPTWRPREICRLQAAGKVGWQAERFWETKDNIYGGISWTTDIITQIWYPSSRLPQPQGRAHRRLYVRPGGRGVQRQAGRRAAADRQGAGREAASRTSRKYVEHGVAIGWNNMEFERIGWADESDPAFRRQRGGAGDAAGPLPHGRRPDHVLERLAGGRDPQRLGGGEVDRPAGQSDDDVIGNMDRNTMNSRSRSNATTGTFRSSTAP